MHFPVKGHTKKMIYIILLVDAKKRAQFYPLFALLMQLCPHGYVLHPVMVMRQSQRSLQNKGTFVLILHGCIATSATSVMESRMGFGLK